MTETPLALMLAAAAVPLLGGTVCALLPQRFNRAGAVWIVLVSAATVLLVLPLGRALWGQPVGAAVVASAWDGRVNLRVDHLSALALMASSVFTLLVALYSLPSMKDRAALRTYHAGLLWTLGLACAAFMADDLLLLLICWGMLGVTLYLLVSTGGSDAAAAAKKTLIMVGGSDCFLLLGVAILCLRTGTPLMSGMEMPVDAPGGWLAFLCFVAAALAKAGGMPVHNWVPDCGEKAPVPVTALLPASLDKLLGIYLLARTCLGLFRLSLPAQTLLMLAGAGTVICAVMMALVQHDLKRLLAYHAVSQVGYMVLGIASGTAIGIAGGLFHMLNNAIYKLCLFLCAGSVEYRAGTTDMDRLGGLARAMPLTFGACLISAMAIAGVPPLNGFFSKWMVYQGLIQHGRIEGGGLWVVWLAAAMVGSALTLASFVKVLHAVFLRKPSAPADRPPAESPFAMQAPMAALAFLCVLFGVAAWRLPLRGFIVPAAGGTVAFAGNWMAGQAAVLLAIAFLLGLLWYRLTTARKPRECATYIGGEIMAELHETGPASPMARDVEVTGVDFYRTIEDQEPFKDIYRMARNKAFDLYDASSKALFYFVNLLRSAHTGNLLLYLTWFLVGLVAVSWMLLRGGRLL